MLSDRQPVPIRKLSNASAKSVSLASFPNRSASPDPAKKKNSPPKLMSKSASVSMFASRPKEAVHARSEECRKVAAEFSPHDQLRARHKGIEAVYRPRLTHMEGLNSYRNGGGGDTFPFTENNSATLSARTTSSSSGLRNLENLFYSRSTSVKSVTRRSANAVPAPNSGSVVMPPRPQMPMSGSRGPGDLLRNRHPRSRGHSSLGQFGAVDARNAA
jgi:hypothetical protein